MHHTYTVFTRIVAKAIIVFLAILGPIVFSNFREYHILLQFIHDNRLIIVL